MHIALRMDKLLITQINGYMNHTLPLFGSSLPPEENQISRLNIAEVRSNVDMLAHISLLRGVTGNDDIVHE